MRPLGRRRKSSWLLSQREQHGVTRWIMVWLRDRGPAVISVKKVRHDQQALDQAERHVPRPCGAMHGKAFVDTQSIHQDLDRPRSGALFIDCDHRAQPIDHVGLSAFKSTAPGRCH